MDRQCRNNRDPDVVSPDDIDVEEDEINYEEAIDDDE